MSRRTALLLAVGVVVLGTASWYRLYYADLLGPTFEFAGETMGTTFLVKVVADSMSPDRYREVADVLTTELVRVNGLMSTWDPNSELSRLNRHESTDPFPISPETGAVLRVASLVSELSGGAFDVTVAPLVQAWGFGAHARVPGGPDAEELAALRERVGWQWIRLDTDGTSVRKLRPGVVCDLSAIAKGFGVDRLAAALDEEGFSAYLIEIGGELRARGRKAAGAPFRVAIELPDAIRKVHEIIPLVDHAMATSGDYRSYYEEDGVRISHTIDPRTGSPIRHRLASVTVLHREAVWADALATALNVLGPDAGYTLAEAEGWPAYFILRTESGIFEVRETSAFTALRDPPK